MSKPFIWQMIKEAAEKNPNVKITYQEIKEYIRKTYSDINENTINAQIIVCTVNQPSRIHYPENKRPRIASTKYDFLFTVGRGQVVLYNREEHGVWEIAKSGFGKLVVKQQLDEDVIDSPIGIQSDPNEEQDGGMLFPLEAQLRDFIVQNISSINVNGMKLKLFVDENSRDGVEYPTEVGLIDILCRDQNGDFVVFELKLGRGPDRAMGQIARYMGWVKKNIAVDKGVSGVIVAKNVDDKLKYAASVVPGISLFEYQVKFSIQQV
ncbi:endonuclease NucS domain-containing protein [Paenibacillus sp. FSL F4-0125]|uniref:endonuclease NucS domain-containing protein n=1 Tax=Paenibacillus sp. FSL F4-0125 TaxID=2954730 RepID=UPI0030F69BEE